MKRRILWLLGFVVGGILALLYPAALRDSGRLMAKYALEMLYIFPPILILMGLADVWVPGQAVTKHLGERSGLRGVLLAIVLGTLPTGPVYLAFPVAAELIKKGASVTNIMIFLGVWASLKIPQIGVEIQFLGLRFAFLRFVFTLTAVLITSFLIGAWQKKRDKEIEETPLKSNYRN